MSCKINPVVEINKLPTLPAIAMEAIRLMEGEESSFSSLADLLCTDQVLAGKILHYANSAFVGSRRKIASIPQAISVLGLDAVRSIILSAAIFDYCSEDLAMRRQSLLNFWLHSIGVGATAEILARRLGFRKPEEAYIAGLLHDLGKLVCLIHSPGQFEQIQQALESQGSYGIHGPSPLDIERQILGTDHIEAGRLLGEQWGFPRIITQVLWLHHQPVFETILPEDANLPMLIRFADVLCVTHNVGSSYLLPPGASYSHDQFHFALENLLLHHHLTPSDIDEIMKEVIARVKQIGNILGFWDEELYRQLIRRANLSLGSLGLKLALSNRQLGETNRVLDATCEMTRKLRPGTGLPEAAAIIAEAACKALGSNRSLCLLRDEKELQFTGQLLDHGTLHQLRLNPEKPDSTQTSGTDIEAEALELLSLVNLDQDRGDRLESGLANLIAGSRFLAAFFPAGEGSLLSEPILGELVVDFAGSPEIGENPQRLLRNFESLSVAAGGAVERLLLERGLSNQARELAESTRKMEESQRQLFHSHRLATVGRLAAGAAHEINNPLTIISLNLQLIDRLLEKQDIPSIKERLAVITGQEERIAKIIHDLMSFARPAQPKFASSSAAAIVASVLSVLDARVSLKKIKVDNRLPDDLPPIMVDPMQIEQVFMNLFINASQAMHKGGELLIEAILTSNFLDVRVSDSGKGIDPQHLNKIFDPFFTTKKQGEGTGLGLAICHSIAEHNGGTLRVQSRLGQGTTFVLSLPLDKGSRLRAMKKRLAQEVPSRIPAAALPDKIPILIVDDERILNDMLQESLRVAGYAVDGAYDGLEAIKLLRQKPYQLLILDIRMPHKDGLEVLEFVKNEYPAIKVLIITAYASRDEIKETARMGAFACLRKPFRLEQVLDTISRAFSRNKKKNPES